ncbi:MAG: threonylcarbamoyl-AMP synthase [Thermoleophilia bacterium]|nr:threonylcarbamoyl-AMP synthase [Thermoleophilia bacterium]
MLVVKDPKRESSELGYARKALEQGQLVIVPTDTVYGLAAIATDANAVATLYAAKGRPTSQQTAVVFANVAALRTEFPELSARASWAVSALLPGPWTLIVDNPQGRLPWLTGGAPGPIGLRVPVGAYDLPPLAATSANFAGEPTITTLADVTPELEQHVAVAIDRGNLGVGDQGAVASTVLDLTSWERGAGPVRAVRDEAERVAQALVVLQGAPDA